MSKFNEDLVAIRKTQKLTVEDIFQKTRISIEVIERIESGAYLESESHKIYARSFVRTYARLLGISEQHIIEALDRHYSGTYNGYLLKYYSVSTTEGDKSANESASVKDPKEKEIKDSESKPYEVVDEPKQSDTKPEPSFEKKESKVESSEPEKKGLFDFDDNTLGSDGKTIKAVKPEAPKNSDVDWAKMQQKSGNRKKKTMMFVPIAIIFLILFVGGGLIWYFVGGTESESDLDMGDIPAVLDTISTRSLDTLRAPTSPDPQLTGQIAISDTLYIEVYAATGNLSPFQVQSDFFAGSRPYWLDAGTSMRIEFFDEITVTNPTGRMLLLYQGRVITEFAERNRDDGSFTFRRSQIESDPSLNAFTRSDFPQGIRSPRETVNRPIIIQ